MPYHDALRDALNAAKMLENANVGRSLEELKETNDILRGVESQRLRNFCTSEYMDITRDLDRYGQLLFQCERSDIERDFTGRVNGYLKSWQSPSDPISISKAEKEVCQDLYALRWGPTRVPIFNLLGLSTMIRPSRRRAYLETARFLIEKGLPVNGTDLSGTTALSHSFSTKPAFDLEYAQMLYDAGGDVNHRNRYGATVAHEILQIFEPSGKTKAAESLKWFLEHGGNVDIADSDGITIRSMAERFNGVFPELNTLIKKEDLRREGLGSACCTLCGMQSSKLLLCSRCKKARYCSPEHKQCQRLDWPRHKTLCKS